MLFGARIKNNVRIFCIEIAIQIIVNIFLNKSDLLKKSDPMNLIYSLSDEYNCDEPIIFIAIKKLNKNYL